MRLSCTSLVALRFGEYRATVAPAAGGRIASLVRTRDGVSCPLIVEWSGGEFDAHDWPKAGAFPMIPFANRLPADGFAFAGKWIRPKPGPSGFALHGFAHRNAWNVLVASDERVLMAYDHEGLDPGWPWAWSATQEVRLAETGVTVNIHVRNASGEPMPLAVGWHPYHPIPREVFPGDLRFKARARRELDAQGTAQDVEGEPAFTMGRGETAAFTDWSGDATLRTTGGVIVIAGEGASNLVVHRPQSGEYLCAEPVSSLPGHLAHAIPLQAGESRSLTWSCRFEPDIGTN
jgi:aldose 1-epimerase